MSRQREGSPCLCPEQEEKGRHPLGDRSRLDVRRGGVRSLGGTRRGGEGATGEEVDGPKATGSGEGAGRVLGGRGPITLPKLCR